MAVLIFWAQFGTAEVHTAALATSSVLASLFPRREIWRGWILVLAILYVAACLVRFDLDSRQIIAPYIILSRQLWCIPHDFCSIVSILVTCNDE